MDSRERHERVGHVFLEATALQGDARNAYLCEACTGDASLRAEVVAMLAEDARPATALQTPPPDAPHVAISRAAAAGDRIPERIGSFTIRSVLGEGGMGVVYLAEQDRPRRTVALKVIRAGLASPATLRRFEHEAEVLARLQHPGIAQIHEAGTSGTGSAAQPYFAMEHVQGKPLLEHARDQVLDVRARLALFARVCNAVQHAHLKGVVHRDLKPGNILVDANGQPKILDFGVSRLTDEDLRTTTMHTDLGALIGTVPYMSPEQAAGDASAVDTRSDIYSLGVILYEMLSGRLPYDVERQAIQEAVRVIREERPSRLSSVARSVRGDVETIVGKALEKDPARRYQNASDLSADITRFLHDQPITARPPSAAYQLAKFARRHQTLVGSATAIAILTLGALAALAWSNRRLILAERRANSKARVTSVIVEAIERGASDASSTSELTVQETLRIATKSLNDGELHDDPRAESEVRLVIGRIQHNLGAWNQAEANIAQAVASRRAIPDISDYDLADSLNALGNIKRDRGDLEEAEPIYRECLELARGIFAPDRPELGFCVSNVGVILRDLRRFAEAELYLREAIELAELRREADPLGASKAIWNLAYMFLMKRDLAAAEQSSLSAIAYVRDDLGLQEVECLDHLQLLTWIYR
jgi:tetratricopeptide (TPR) repeat protein/predicted Ser/Thr protein kinase